MLLLHFYGLIVGFYLFISFFLLDPSYIESSFLWKLFTVYLIALCARLKYYFAWCISESVCNASGLGFNGIDPKTERPKWNLMTNIDILGFEVSFAFFSFFFCLVFFLGSFCCCCCRMRWINVIRFCVGTSPLRNGYAKWRMNGRQKSSVYCSLTYCLLFGMDFIPATISRS